MSSVTFLPVARPLLIDGAYTVSITQTITLPASLNDPGEVLTASASFEVNGPRFQLPVGMVWGQYPPTGGTGDYSATLPYLTLTDPTLPWQRTASATGVAPPAPWLALLVFDETDPPPAPVAGTLADLIPIADGGTLPVGTYAAAITTDPAYPNTTPLAYIDVPAPLFNAIAPGSGDLRLALPCAERGRTGRSADPERRGPAIDGRRRDRQPFSGREHRYDRSSGQFRGLGNGSGADGGGAGHG